MTGLAGRLAAIDDVTADPPQVHAYSGTAQTGVWGTVPACYRFLAEHVGPGTRTLETGLGASTVLFTRWGAEHTCVTSSRHEADVLVDYLDARGVDRGRLRLEVGSSTDVLPRLLGDGELDLVFVDGCHGWPVPILDWFYAAARLRAGGIVVFDDVNMAQVSLGLVDFLDADPRWERLFRAAKWVAYRRRSGGSLVEEWDQQPFVPARPPGLAAALPAPVRGLARRLLRR